MDNKNLVKAAIIFGGGFLLFLALKPKAQAQSSSTPATPSTSDSSKSFDDSPKPTMENAEIVAMAYSEALKNAEPPTRLTELNQEMMKDFGMRCYVDKQGQVVVCDKKGSTVLTK